MADSVPTEANRHRLTKYGRLRQEDPNSDEYIQQYLLFHYDFHRTQGFGIEWEKFDFFIPYCVPYDGAPRLKLNKTNEELIKDETLDAIVDYNAKNGKNIVFVEHIEANFMINGFFQNWITFWAEDLSLPFHKPKIYQTHTKERAGRSEVLIFRVKPTEEELAAAPIHVNPPQTYRPYGFGHSKPVVFFSFAGPEEVPVPGTPFIFKRLSYGPPPNVIPPPRPSLFRLSAPIPSPPNRMNPSPNRRNRHPNVIPPPPNVIPPPPRPSLFRLNAPIPSPPNRMNPSPNRRNPSPNRRNRDPRNMQ